MRKSNAPPGSKQRRALALVSAPPPVVSRDQRKNVGQLPLQPASTGHSARLGGLLHPTGDSTLQNRSIFQSTEPSVFAPPREKEKTLQGRSQACNVPPPSETPAPIEVTKEGKHDSVHQRTTALMTCGNPSASAVPHATTRCCLKPHGSMDRRKEAEQKSFDYEQSLLQQYKLQQRVPQDDQPQSSKRQCESNKLCERDSSLTTSHQHPIAALVSAVEGNARAIRCSSPSNMQQTGVEQKNHPSEHHPVVAPINIPDLAATDQLTHALNEERLRAQLVQRDQEIAGIMDRLAQSEEAQCVMAVTEAETSSRLNKELSRLQSELNFKSHSIQETERELKRIKTEKAIEVKEEALHMAAEAKKMLLEKTESKAPTYLKSDLQQQSLKVCRRQIDGKHGRKTQSMHPTFTHRVPYSGHSSPQLQTTYTFQFQQLLSFLSGDGANDIMPLYNPVPDASSALKIGCGAVGDQQPTCPSQSVLEMLPAAPPVSCHVGTILPSSLPCPPISSLPSPEQLHDGKDSPLTCVPPPQGSSAPVEDGNQSSTCLIVNEGSYLNEWPSKVNSTERLKMLPKRLNECLLDIQLGRQRGSELIIVLGEYLSSFGTQIQFLKLLQSVVRLLTGVLGLCSEARALVLSMSNTTSISLRSGKQHHESLSCSQSSSLLDQTQCGVEDSGGPVLQVNEDTRGDAAFDCGVYVRKCLVTLFQWCMANVQDGSIGTTDTEEAAGRTTVVDFAEDLCNTLLVCLQESSTAQLEAWGGLCDGNALNFAFFAKSSSPRLKELAMELLRCLMQSKKLFSRVSSCPTTLPTLEAAGNGGCSSYGNIQTHSIISPSSNHPLLRRLCNVSFSFQPGRVQSPLRPISLGLYLRLIRLCLLLCARYGKDAFNHLLRDDKESGFSPIHLLPKLVHFIRVEVEGWEQVRDENVLSPYVLSPKKKAIHQTRSAVIRESFQLLVRLVQNSPRPLRETVVAAGMHDGLLALVDKLYNGASFESLNVAVEAKNLVAQVNTL